MENKDLQVWKNISKIVSKCFYALWKRNGGFEIWYSGTTMDRCHHVVTVRLIVKLVFLLIPFGKSLQTLMVGVGRDSILKVSDILSTN